MNGFKSDGTPEDSIDLSDGWNKYPQVNFDRYPSRNIIH
jgi:hypothetical protein